MMSVMVLPSFTASNFKRVCRLAGIFIDSVFSSGVIVSSFIGASRVGGRQDRSTPVQLFDKVGGVCRSDVVIEVRERFVP